MPIFIYLGLVYILLFCIKTEGVNNTTSSSDLSDKVEESLFDWKDWKFLVSAGGAVLTVICIVLLCVVSCLLSNTRKRLSNLEVKFKEETLKRKEVLHQTSSQSNYASDIETIPKVPRRSEYIRQRFVNEIQNFGKRVSKTFPFFNTPRSSADTFDLGKTEDPIYEDVTNYRKDQEDPPKTRTCCLCCCYSPSPHEYTKARTSEVNVNGIENHPGKKSDINEHGEQCVDAPKMEKDNYHIKNEVNKIKTKHKQSEPTCTEIEVQHVDFDVQGQLLQLKETADISIRGSPNTIRHVNKLNQLTSFGKTVQNSKLEMPLHSEPVKQPHETSATAPATDTRTFCKKGIKLPMLSIPPKLMKTLPSVHEEPPTASPGSGEIKSEKERDPSYIDMSETLRKENPP